MLVQSVLTYDTSLERGRSGGKLQPSGYTDQRWKLVYSTMYLHFVNSLRYKRLVRLEQEHLETYHC
jgi:hypothetical protein